MAKPKHTPPLVETRKAPNGRHYTYQQFRDYFGPLTAAGLWMAAEPPHHTNSDTPTLLGTPAAAFGISLQSPGAKVASIRPPPGLEGQMKTDISPTFDNVYKSALPTNDKAAFAGYQWAVEVASQLTLQLMSLGPGQLVYLDGTTGESWFLIQL